MSKTLDMARASHLDLYGLGKGYMDFLDALKRFEALVRADERDKWMERTAILIRGERKACEDLAEKEAQYSVAAAIRARGETK